MQILSLEKLTKILIALKFPNILLKSNFNNFKTTFLARERQFIIRTTTTKSTTSTTVTAIRTGTATSIAKHNN